LSYAPNLHKTLTPSALKIKVPRSMALGLSVPKRRTQRSHLMRGAMGRSGVAGQHVSWIAACFVGLGSPAIAAERPDLTLALPRMEPCERIPHPLLPAKWRGVFLMTPFTPSQLLISEIVYDEAVPAMQVKLFGVRSGAANLLVLKDKTFVIEEDPVAPCEELEPGEWTPLPRDLLAPRAQCAGLSPISETLVEWWKSPSEPPPLADWMWVKPSDRSPFRLLFQKPSDHLSVLSAFALTHQIHFEPLTRTDLAPRAGACTKGEHRRRRGVHDVLKALGSAPLRADAEIARLFPELQLQCSSRRPHWPEALGMTMFLTPIDFGTNPVPAEVLYNWKQRAQRTRMFWGVDAPTTDEDALMLAEHGYSVSRQRSGDVQCIPALPGTPRPNWLEEAPCTCEGMIGAGSALAPYGPAEILRCPATSPRLFWTWHTLAGRPMVFMVTPSRGDEPTALITLADYYAWVPGYPSSAGLFARPAQCPDLSMGRGPRIPRPPGRATEPCGRCHLTFDKPK
jgi:hypothetical protein